MKLNFFKNQEKGLIVTLVLVFGSVFMLLISGLFGFILIQHRQSLQKVSHAQALEIAEAGINYYRWHLAHDPNDLQDGTGAPGPYVHNYDDPSGGTIGQFSLDIQGTIQCNTISGVTITSTGWTSQFPSNQRTVSAKYARPTVAEYSFLLNDNVWAGADRVINGPYHSNGGIRMDGTNNSTVSSALTDWLCTASFGCNPAVTQPGVFGAGPNSGFWSFPVPPFDFNGITVDLAQMKTLAQGGDGLYFAPSGDDGYHVYLRGDRSADVFVINSLTSVYTYSSDVGAFYWEDSIINTETFLGNYSIPSGCGLVFFEDDLWVSSEVDGSIVSGKVTLVSADLIDPTAETDVWLNGDITYTTTDGTDSLVLLGQHNNLIGVDVPDDMTLHGVYIAQTGHYGRNHYTSSNNPYHYRNSLTIYGSIVSNGRVGTKWSYSSGAWASGFNQRASTYDPNMSYDPPAFLPTTSLEQRIREWQEIE